MPSNVTTSRRQFLRTVSGIATVGLSGCAAIRQNTPLNGTNQACPIPEQPFPEAWPMEGYDRQHTCANLNATGPKSDVTIEWTDGGHGLVRSTPIVSHDAVYLNGHPNKLQAFAKATGEMLWTLQMDARPDSDTEVTYPSAYSTPTVVGETLYVGGGNIEYKSKNGETTHVSDHLYLFAIDCSSGEIQWKFQTDEYIHTAPVIVGDTLLFATRDGTMYAVDTDEREVKWQFSDVDSPVGPIPTPAVNDCAAYVNIPGKGLFAFDVRDGELKWRMPDVRSSSAPAVVSGSVYVGSNDGKLLAIDGKEGVVKWTYQTGGTTAASSPAIADDVVVVGDSSDESGIPTQRIHAVDAKSGDEIWTAETEEYVRATPAIADSVVYVAAGNDVFGIDIEGGEKLWQHQLNRSVIAPLSVIDQRVYVATDTGQLYVLSEKST